MPTVFLGGKFAIMVYTRDHRPVHCHVKWDEHEIKVELPSYTYKKLSSTSPTLGDITTAIELVKANRNKIGQTWRTIHGD